MSKLFILGGATVDVYATSKEKIILEDSNIGTISFSYGGVARNIAENLASLGEKVFFVSVFGNDPFSNLLYKDCEELGFDLTYAKKVNGPCPMYLAVLNNDRNMMVAINDMDIMNEFDKAMIDRLADVISDDDYVLVDPNVSTYKIEYICQTLKGHKVSDAISTEKALRLENVLDKLSILKMNIFEAEALAKRRLENEDDIAAYINQLLDNGTSEVIVTVRDGLLIGKDNKVYRYYHDAFDKNIKNVTGAGDATLSGYLCGRYHNLNANDSSIMALACAVLTVQSEKACAGINKKDISNVLKTLKISSKKISRIN